MNVCNAERDVTSIYACFSSTGHIRNQQISVHCKDTANDDNILARNLIAAQHIHVQLSYHL